MICTYRDLFIAELAVDVEVIHSRCQTGIDNSDGNKPPTPGGGLIVEVPVLVAGW